MTKKQIYNYLSSLTAIIHIGFILLYIACVFLMITSKELRFYTALFFCLMWIQLKIFNGCSLTRLEGYFQKKGGKKYDDDVFFCNRIVHSLFKEKFCMPAEQLRMLIQRIILFFCVISGAVLILHLY